MSLGAGAPTLLRPGGVAREELEEALGETLVEGAAPTERPLAPGQLSRHYSTRTPVRILPGPASSPAAEQGGKLGLLAWDGDRDRDGYVAVEVLAPDGRPTTAATRLFAALRHLDGLGLDAILAEPCEERGLGAAIMDRLRRCAARS